MIPFGDPKISHEHPESPECTEGKSARSIHPKNPTPRGPETQARSRRDRLVGTCENLGDKG